MATTSFQQRSDVNSDVDPKGISHTGIGLSRFYTGDIGLDSTGGVDMTTSIEYSESICGNDHDHDVFRGADLRDEDENIEHLIINNTTQTHH
jgi:hypothetical protein